MLKIITVITVCYDKLYGNPETAFREVMQLLAEHYKEYGSKANFAVINSYKISDICFSSQNFFNKTAEEIFLKNGITGIKVQGICGGSYDAVNTQLKEFGENIKYLDGIKYAAKPVLYKLKKFKK